MNNAEKFQKIFGIYATEMWAMPESEFLSWLNSLHDVNATNTTDMISRQDAIRWVKTECNPYGKPTLDFESGVKVIEHLKQMPSAEQWIPCSERLPEVGEDVFISVGGDVWEAHLRASKEYFLIHSGRMLVKTEETDAWMPLPKAYEGRKE